MLYYIILCILVISLYFTASTKRYFLFSDFIEKCCIYFAIIISATRVDVGLDYNSYLSQIRRIAAIGGQGFGDFFTGWSFNTLINFISQIKIIGFTEEFRIIIAISSIITIIANLSFIKTFSIPNLQKQAVGMYLLIPLFYLASFNVIRSSLSISFLYFAMVILLKKKNIIYSILLVILSITTHAIGIIFLSTSLLTFILDKFFTSKPKLSLIIFFILILAFWNIFSSGLTPTLINIYSYFPFPDHYLISGFEEFVQGKGIGLISVIPISLLSAFFYFLLMKNSEIRIQFIRVQLISCTFIPLIIFLSGVITYAQYVRLISPYLIFLMLAFLELIDRLNNFKLLGSQIFIYSISVLYFFRNIYVSGEITNLLPYSSWLLP